MRGDRRVYRSDPIQEAFCELQFRLPMTGWALVPGLLYDRLRDVYPAVPTQDGPILNAGPNPLGPDGQQFQLVIGQGIPSRIRLCNEDNTEQLLIAGNSVSINCLRPYTGWENFRERIVRVLTTLNEIFQDGFDVQRIGVRYINKVDSPLGDVDRYFGVKPVRLSDSPLRLANFICRSELPTIDDENTLIIVTFSSAFGDKSIVLDLDAISKNITNLTSVDDCLVLIDRLREMERDAFEMSITDEAREGPFGGFDVASND